MKRWHDDFKKTNETWKIHHDDHVETNKWRNVGRIGKSPYEIDCECDLQKGRFRKASSPFCNRKHCFCRSDKLGKRKLTFKEIKNKLKFKEQLQEI